MKLNKEQLKIILDDLYAIDPKLRDFEAELEKIIREIVELEPDIKFDENFRSQLKVQLMARAQELAGGQAQKKTIYNFFGGKFSYGLAGAVALAIIVIGAGYYAKNQGIISFPNQQIENIGQGQEPFSYKKITLSTKEAFGPLAGTTKAAPGTSASAPQGAGGGLGGGGGVRTESGGGGSMIYPGFYYKYIYKGQPLELNNSQIEVLRRIGFDQNVSSFGGLLKSFGLGLVNMGSFDSLKVQNVNLAEDKDFGYFISSNILEGTIYISQNWLKWPQPYKLCAGEALCMEQNRLKISEVLPDSEVIKIAKDFIKAHGISIASYGEPEVTDTWRIEYQKIDDKSQFYIPESANVLFPLKLNGQYVYDESGSKTGMNLNVDFRQKKVSGAGNITSQTYESSSYSAETDAQNILKLVEQGGYWGNPYPMAEKAEGVNQLILEVGTPKIEYVAFSNYGDGRANFLFVPSLIFPITKTPPDTNYYYPKNIVIPLAKELLEQRYRPPYVIQ